MGEGTNRLSQTVSGIPSVRLSQRIVDAFRANTIKIAGEGEPVKTYLTVYLQVAVSLLVMLIRQHLFLASLRRLSKLRPKGLWLLRGIRSKADIALLMMLWKHDRVRRLALNQ